MPTSRKTYRNDNVKISINGYTLLGLLISSLRVECKASETLHIHLGLAIRTQDAVLLLLNIGELSIDITLTVGDGMSRVGQGLIALKKGFFIGNLAMISPRTAAFVLECNIAIFSQQEGLVACPFFAVAVDHTVDAGMLCYFFTTCKMLGQHIACCGVIMQSEDIALNEFPAIICGNNARAIQRLYLIV